MDEVFEAILESRTRAIEEFLTKHELSFDDMTKDYGLDIVTLANGDEKVSLYKKEPIDSTVITYKVGYGK